MTRAEANRLVLAWLESIGETDQAIIDEVLQRCKEDADALAYFVWRGRQAVALRRGRAGQGKG